MICTSSPRSESPDGRDTIYKESLRTHGNQVESIEILIGGIDALRETRGIQYEEAEGLYREVISLQPDLIEARFNLAATLGKSGDDAGAIETYRQILDRTPQDVQTLVSLGFLVGRHGELDEAAGYFQRVVDLEPDHAQAHFNLATIRSGLGQAALAEKHYRRAAELDPVYAKKVRGLRR